MVEVIEALAKEVRALRLMVEERGAERLTAQYGEAARILGLKSPKTIARMVNRGVLQSVLISGTMMIPLAELRRISTPKQTRAVGQRPKAATGHAAKAEIEAMLKRKR